MAPYEVAQEVYRAQMSDLEQQLALARNQLAVERRKVVIFKRALEDIQDSKSLPTARVWARDALERVK